MRLEVITGLRLLIIAFIYYVITFTFTGWFESIVARQVGDDTPEQAGYVSLNPLDHFNVFGFAAVIWSIFFARLLPFEFIPGWGRHIPLMPDTIQGGYYRLRIFVEYIGRSIAHFLLVISSAVIIMLLCGAMHVHGMVPMLSSHATSFKEALVILLYFFCQQNVILFVIHFIIGIFKYIIYFHRPQIQDFSFTTMLLGFFALIICLSIFGPLLEIFVLYVIESIRSLLLLIKK